MTDYIIIVLLVVYRFVIKTVSASLSVLEVGRLTYDIGDEKLEKKIESYKLKSNFYMTAASLMSVIIQIFSGIIIYSRLVNLFRLNPALFSDGNGFSPAGYIAFLAAILLLSVVFTVVGGPIPRNIAIKNPIWYIVTFGFLLKLTSFVLYPLVRIISAFSIKMSQLELDPDDFEIEEDTHDEIQQLLSTGEESGTIDENEREMIENVLAIDEITAEDILTHRKEIVALPSDCKIDDIKKIILYEKYTRIPVYEKNIDNIIGILNTKDFIRYYLRRTGTKFNIKRLLKPTFYVPTNKKADEIFEQMQREKIHLAVVVDEYGGTLGIVTMEDNVEEVMGNILDEFDIDEIPIIAKNEDGSFTIDGTAQLDEVREELEVSDFEDDEDIDTIGGYMISRLGYIPEDNSEFECSHDGWIFKAEKIEGKRVVLIKAEKILSRLDNRAHEGEESPGSAEQDAG